MASTSTQRATMFRHQRWLSAWTMVGVHPTAISHEPLVDFPESACQRRQAHNKKNKENDGNKRGMSITVPP